MEEDKKLLKDVLMAVYQENLTQCRHHETQRSTMTSTILALDTLIIGVITFDKNILFSDFPLILFLIVIGVFGAAFSLKQYERYRFHLERSRSYRKKIDELFAGGMVDSLKKEADGTRKRFLFLDRFRLYYWWIALHLMGSGIGVALAIVSIFFPIESKS